MNSLLIGFCVYFAIVSLIALISFVRKQKLSSTYSQAILGSRSINYVLTAFSAHASDMSDWLFMAFPAALYTAGLMNAWIAVGLVGGMCFVWHYIAPALRIETERYNAMTLSTYFEKRFDDRSGVIRLLTAVVSLIFFAIYIAAGLKGFGFLAESIFHLSYQSGVLFALCSVVLYIFFGGYRSLSWIDSFQAVFLLMVIVYVPYVAWSHVGGWKAISYAAGVNSISLYFMPRTVIEFVNAVFIAISWGIGYVGTPHILTKFMGMDNVNEMKKARNIGIAWQMSVLFAAGLVGLIAIPFFVTPLVNKELVFIEMVKVLFSPLTAGFILSAVAGATLSVVTAQVLVLVSVLTEDIYRNTIKKQASDTELLWVYRTAIILIVCMSFFISLNQQSSIQQLVYYAWMGLGSSFGPLVFVALHVPYINRYGAYASILSGSSIALFWNSFCYQSILLLTGIAVPAVIPGFVMSMVCAYCATYVSNKLIE